MIMSKKDSETGIHFEFVDHSSIKDLRNRCLDESAYPQELFIEWMVIAGDCVKITENRNIAGYFVRSKENILTEFFLSDEYITRKEEIFERILHAFSVTKVYCKSFDHLLLTCCHTYCKSSKIIGTIFRDHTNDILFEIEDELSVRFATESDIPFLLTFEDELYEDPEELKYTVTNKMLLLFEKGKQLIGCGYLIRILPDRNYYDIGMWTASNFRKQGYATKIIAYLKKYCFENGYIPVCGCASDNVASRKTLEKNGFRSKHCIIEFDFE